MVESRTGGVKAPDGSLARGIGENRVDLPENGDPDRPMFFAVCRQAASEEMCRDSVSKASET